MQEYNKSPLFKLDQIEEVQKLALNRTNFEIS